MKETQNTIKVKFNRENLKEFFESTKFDNTKITTVENYIIYYVIDFYNYFISDTLSWNDEKTGCYVSHLIFQEFPNYNDTAFFSFLYTKKAWTLSELKYAICSRLVEKIILTKLSPFKVNEKGELYLESVIRATDIDDIYVRNEFEKAMTMYGINIPNHKDYQGNNLLHWLAATGRDLTLFYQFFEESNFKEKNNYGISVEDILKTINSLQPFRNLEINETDNYLNISTEEKKEKPNLKYGDNPEYYQIKNKSILKKNDLLYYLFDGNREKLFKISKQHYPQEEEFKYYNLKKKKVKNN